MVLRKILAAIIFLSLAVPASVVLNGTETAHAAMKKKPKKKSAKKTKKNKEKKRNKTKRKQSSSSYDDDVALVRSGSGALAQAPTTAAGSAGVGAAVGTGAAAVLPRPVVDDANRALDIVKRLCLSGDTLRLTIDIGGTLQLSKTTPQGTVNANADATRAEGGVLFRDENIRRLVDERTSNCLVGQWSTVYRILQEGKNR